MTGHKQPQNQPIAALAMQHSDFREHLRQERDRFVAFSFASADILLELDAQQQIVFIDGAIHGLLGYKHDELLGKNWLELMAEADREPLTLAIDELDTKHRMEKMTASISSAYGDAIPFTISAFRLNHLLRHTYISLSLMRGDVLLDQIIKRDPNTGLLNSASFVDHANAQIQHAQQHGETLDLTLLDFPELTKFLGELSPPQAERLLLDISAYLKQHSLGGDTAGVISDEAFGMLHDKSQAPASILSDLIEMTRQYDPKHQGIAVRSSTIEADASNLTSQDSANILLYTLNAFASHQGDNFCITNLRESYDQLLSETVAKVTQFKQTVQDSAFDMAFQPIVDLKSALIHHFEVLVRIKNPDNFKNPFDFINFGEKTGVISEFDLLMTKRTFEILHDTARKGNYPVVAVNLSGRSVSSALFRDTLLAIVEQHSKFRKQIIFEFTESARIDDMQIANDFIQILRAGGSLCCLDDFGTGESSFDYLRSLQVDFIKIDGSYVRESLQTQRGRHMLKAMASLCRDLNVTTIGEMVEDEQAAALLWECGVKFGQGYLFGKPEIDVETLINCKKPTPFYGGMMRVRKMKH